MSVPFSPLSTGVACAPFVGIERDLTRAEPLWRAFERANPGRLFQRFDWAGSWFRTLGAREGATPVVVAAFDAQARPIALMPFAQRAWRAVNILEWPGGAHASFNAPLALNGGLACADRHEARAFLRAVARAVGDIDLFSLGGQPERWDGAPHPFAQAHAAPIADHGWERSLGGDGEALIQRILTGDARKKMRNKERRLAELGEVRLWRAGDAPEAERVLAAFFAQAAARFTRQNIWDPFASAGAQAFLRDAATRGLDQGAPAIELHALSAGERIVALFGGPRDGARFSCMFTSFDNAPEVSRYSPGDILLRHLVSRLSSDGVAAFDLGVGDARYKRAYCDAAIEMFETRLACTPAGAALGTLLGARAFAKRQIKRRPALIAVARRMLRRGG